MSKQGGRKYGYTTILAVALVTGGVIWLLVLGWVMSGTIGP